MRIMYETRRAPTVMGVYAVRVPIAGTSLYEDKFMLWDQHAGQWFFLGSDQTYRGDLGGWLGPLPREL